MATQIKVDVDANVSAFVSALKTAGSELKSWAQTAKGIGDVELGADASELMAALKQASGEVKTFGGIDATAELLGDASNLERELDQAKADLRGIDGTDAKAELRGDAADIDRAIERAKSDLRGIDGSDAKAEIRGDASQLERVIDEAKSDLRSLDSEKVTVDIGADGQGFGSSIGSMLTAGGVIGGPAGAAGVAAGAFFTAGVAEALSRQDLENKIQSAGGFSDQSMERLADQASSVYANAFGESYDQVLATVGDVAKTDFGQIFYDGAGDITQITSELLAVADAMDIEVSEAITATSDLFANGFGKTGTESLDILTKTLQSVPEAMRGPVTDAMSEYNDHFKALGFSGEGMFLALRHAASQGEIELDKYGDALKELTIRGTDLSTSSEEALAQVGLNVDTVANQLLAGGESARTATRDIANGLLGIQDPATQASLAVALFGTPVEDLGTDQIPAFLQSLTYAEAGIIEFDGAAAEVAARSGESFSSWFTGIKRSGEENLVGFLNDTALPAITSFTDAFTTYWPAIQETVSGVFDTVKTVVGGVITDIQAKWATDGEGLMASMRSLWETVSTIFLTAITLIKTLWDTFGADLVEFASDRFTAIMNIIQGALTIIQGVIQTVTAVIKGDWSGAWDGIVTIFRGAWQLMKGLIQNALAPIELAIRAALSLFKSIFKGAFDGIIETVKGAWDAIKNGVSSAWDGIKSAFSTAWGAIKAVFDAALSALKSSLGSTWDSIKGAASSAWDSIKSAIGAAWDAIKGAVGSAVDAIKGVISSAWDAVKGATTSAYDAIRGAITTAWDNIKGNVSSAVDAVKSVIAAAWSAIQGAIGGAWGAIRSAISSAWDGIKSAVSSALDAVKSSVRSAWDSIRSTIAGFAGGLTSAARTAFGGVISAITGTLSGLYGRVRDAVIGPLERIWNEARQIVDRITGLGSGVRNRVTSFARNLYHTGGVVHGDYRGQEVPALLRAGEVVLSLSDLAAIEQAGRIGTSTPTAGAPLVGVMNVTPDRSIDDELRLAQMLYAA